MFSRGIAMAFAFVPMQAATYANITPVDTGRASALYSTQRQVSAALGVALLGTILVSRIDSATAGLTDPAAIAQGTLSGSIITWSAEGDATEAGIACHITLTGTAELGENSIRVPYSGDTCAGKVSGVEILNRK
jgi:hypothetical protein